MRRKAAFEVFCLTTVYPTSTHGVHGNSGGKSAGKDVFPSGKGQKCLKSSGNRYSCNVWDVDAAGSNPVTRTIYEHNTRRYQKRLNCMTPCEYYFATAV